MYIMYWYYIYESQLAMQTGLINNNKTVNQTKGKSWSWIAHRSSNC